MKTKKVKFEGLSQTYYNDQYTRLSEEDSSIEFTAISDQMVSTTSDALGECDVDGMSCELCKKIIILTQQVKYVHVDCLKAVKDLIEKHDLIRKHDITLHERSVSPEIFDITTRTADPSNETRTIRSRKGNLSVRMEPKKFKKSTNPKKSITQLRITKTTILHCPVCEKSFPNVKDARNHYLQVHNRKTLACPHCDQYLARESNLATHIQRMHSNADDKNQKGD